MEAIFLLLVSAVGVSQCQDTAGPSASYGVSNSFIATSANRSPSISVDGQQSTPPRSSVSYDTPFSQGRTTASSHGKPPQVMKSSSTLSRDYVEEILDATEELEWFPEGRDGAASAVLTRGVYQGKRMLVYRLAPGAIFGGVRTAGGNNRESQSSDIYLDNNQINHVNPDSSVLKSGYGRYKGNEGKFVNGPVFKWGVQHLKAPQPLASLQKPYLPPHGNNLNVGHRTRQKFKSGGRVRGGAGVGSVLGEAVAQAVRAARSNTRGAWLSLLLLHYLGFLPPLPGLPRHKDPDEVKPSIVNSPSRAL